MKKHLLLLLGILLSLPSAARDFDYTYEGQTITYTVLDENTKTVATKAGTSSNPGNNVSGALILPSVVLDGETEYTLTRIGRYAFYGCRGLTSVTIPNSVTSIGDIAFADCSGLTSVTIPNSVTTIGNSVFADCSGLTSVVIGNSVTTIGNRVFYNCSGLTSVVIGNSVTSIGYSAFDGCISLTSITVEAGNTAYASLDGVLFNKDLSTLIQFPGGCTGNYSIPNSVTSIGWSAFARCSGLTSVTISNSVTTIDSNAFSDCSGLTSIEIPNSVTSIGSYAFWSCSGLTSVSIPNSVTSIGNSAFYKCSGLTSVHITDIAAWCRIGFEEESSNPLSYANNLYLNGNKVENLVIPNSINSVKNYAFYGCSGLTSVEIPNSVTSIGEMAFSLCRGLTSVVIPNSVTSIGNFAFWDCRGLTSVVIPNSVTSIGDVAFYDCSGLTSITVEAGNTAYASLDGVLFNKDLSTLIQFPGGCTGNYSIPNSVTSISNRAFTYCSGLTSVIIPNSVKTIDIYAFFGCSGLTSVYYGADKPIAGDKNIFDGFTYAKATLYTTENGAHIARTIDPWKNFVNIEKYDFSGIDEIVADNVAAGDIDYDAPYDVYNLNGVNVGNSIDCLAPGLYIVRQGGKVKKLKIQNS